MTVTIRRKTMMYMLIGVMLLITWGMGTILLFVAPKVFFASIFLYTFGSIITFIFLNMEYNWVKVE